MNEEQLKGQWEQLKGKIQQRWAKLTENDLSFIRGKKQELIGKIVERHGIAKEKAEQDVEQFIKGIDKGTETRTGGGTTTTGSQKH